MRIMVVLTCVRCPRKSLRSGQQSQKLKRERCEMSVLSVVCLHPGPTHGSDKTEQWPRGGFVQVPT